MLNIERTDREDITVLALEGNLDVLNAPNLKREAEQVVADGRLRVVLDLSRLELVDSSGVGSIVSLFKQVRTRNGDLKIAGLTQQPLTIFKLLRLDKAFDLAPSTQDAASRFEK
ncbi:MAG: STAS domain-containing protein [Myxococcota bacterium]